MTYRREIDGLRAVSVLSVILYHADLRIFRGGFVGVDVFFVISGYLITTILLAEQKTGTFSLVNFYERRARRILPALFTVALACLPFAWLWLVPVDLESFSRSLIAVSAFASNILFYKSVASRSRRWRRRAGSTPAVTITRASARNSISPDIGADTRSVISSSTLTSCCARS